MIPKHKKDAPLPSASPENINTTNSGSEQRSISALVLPFQSAHECEPPHERDHAHDVAHDDAQDDARDVAHDDAHYDAHDDSHDDAHADAHDDAHADAHATSHANAHDDAHELQGEPTEQTPPPEEANGSAGLRAHPPPEAPLPTGATHAPSTALASDTNMANDKVSHTPQPHNHSPTVSQLLDDDGILDHQPTISDSNQLNSSKGVGDDEDVTHHSLPNLSAHESGTQDGDESNTSVTRSSSSSSLLELGSDASGESELRAKLVELNGKIAAIAIIEKEKDRQLEEKTKQLAIREKQLESAMERQASLSSELQNLTEEVEKLRQRSSSSAPSSTNDIVESLKEEFSRRLGATEKKLQAVTKERDELKKGASMGDQAKSVVKAKDDEINALRAEGTNLSHKILNLESALKKYRAAKRDDDAAIASLREKLNQTESLLEKRNDRVKQLEFSEKKYLGVCV
jgi:predicted  nucleic acid-binding Zn-ribbon protein